MKTSSKSPSSRFDFLKIREKRFLAVTVTALTVFACGGVGIGRAADQTWSNGASNALWDASSLNWSGAAWTNGNNAIFGATGAGAITVTDTRTVGNMTFNSGGYSFSGGTLQFNGGGVTIATGANNVSIASAISLGSVGDVSKTGAGTLTLNGNVTMVGGGTFGNTFSQNAGNVNITGGNWQLTDMRLRGFVAGSAINISGGTLVFDGTLANRGIHSGNNGTVNISGGNVTTNRLLVANGSSGTISVSGSAVVDVTGTNIWEVGTGANAATATLNLNGGTIYAYRIGTTLGTGVDRVVTINLNGTIIKATGEHLNWISPFNDAGNNSVNSRINVLAGGAILDSNGNNVRIFRNLTGSAGDGGIRKQGAGIVYLTGNNTVQGNTIVEAGTLLVGNSNAGQSSTGSGNVIVKSGATFGGRGIVTGSVTAESGSTLIAGSESSTSFSTTTVGTLTTGSQTWQGGAGLQMEFSNDGSTGSAGTQWDRFTINGGLNLTSITAETPFTISLFTMSDATTRGALASWNPDVDSVWLGFVTTTTGISGFSADKFAFNTSGFANTLNGSFSLALDGNNLNLVYTAVPEPSTLGALLGLGLMTLAAWRRTRGQKQA